MEFLEKNGRAIAIGFLAFLVVGAIFAFMSYSSKNKEEAAQEKLAAIEFEYTRYKQDVAMSMDVPVQNIKDKSKPENKAATAEAAAKIVNQRTQLITQLNQFVEANPKTIASHIASLYLSELLLNENKTAEAIQALQKANAKSKDLTSVLLQKKLAALLADNNQCEDALKIWDNIVSMKSAKFAVGEIKILQSLCYQKMNNLAKAEEILNSVKNDQSEAAFGFSQHADRILRLIQFKKATGS